MTQLRKTDAAPRQISDWSTIASRAAGVKLMHYRDAGAAGAAGAVSAGQGGAAWGASARPSSKARIGMGRRSRRALMPLWRARRESAIADERIGKGLRNWPPKSAPPWRVIQLIAV